MIRFGLIGLGSIGRRHVANLRKLGFDPIVLRSGTSDAPPLDGVREVRTWSEFLDAEIDAVIVANPTSMHVQTAIECVKSGRHVLIEKPLSHNRERIDELIDLARSRERTAIVGYNSRLNPSLQFLHRILAEGAIGRLLYARFFIGQYLPDWRADTNYRHTYSAKKELGGGVGLDLSHEVDLAVWFCGSFRELTALSNRFSPLDIDTEDLVEILAVTEQGSALNIHMDYLYHPFQRECELLGEKGTLRWNYLKNSVWHYQKARGKWTKNSFGKFDRNAMFVEELKHFIDCVEGKAEPVVGLAQALETLDYVLAARTSAETGKRVRFEMHAYGSYTQIV